MGNGGFGEILEKRHAFIFAYNTPAGAVVPSETPASQVGHLLVTRRTPSARRKKVSSICDWDSLDKGFFAPSKGHELKFPSWRLE